MAVTRGGGGWWYRLCRAATGTTTARTTAWILRVLGRPRRVLDVGCGDGLLLQRLAPTADTVVGLEPDPVTAERARQRVAGLPGVAVIEQGLQEFAATDPFDAVVFVASLHHIGLATGIRRAKELLTPGGRLVVVGLLRNRSVGAWTRSALTLPVIRVAGMVHRETRDLGVPVADARESAADLRRVVRAELPGARWRYGLYYRYLLRWTAPGGVEAMGLSR